MSFVWALEVVRADGSVACRTPLLPDWGAASGWVRFQGIRRGALPPVLSSEPGEVEPLWDARRGAPYAAAVQITIRPPDGAGAEPVRELVPVACLAGQIADVLRVLVQAGRLVQGEVVQPSVCAHHVAERATELVDSSAPGGGIGIEDVPLPLRLRDTAIDRFRRVARPHGATAEDDDVPVFIPAHVLAETEALARAAVDVETGGFLIGHLHRDAALHECFVEVTAQVPARHTVAERTRLCFTPDTWAAVDEELRARGRQEEVMGWVHSHPFFCRACPPERRRSCTLDGTFFSAEDVRLHALGFGQAYKTALLLSERAGGVLERALFGWRRGVVAARGFYEIADVGVPPVRPDVEEVTT